MSKILIFDGIRMFVIWKFINTNMLFSNFRMNDRQVKKNERRISKEGC